MLAQQCFWRFFFFGATFLLTRGASIWRATEARVLTRATRRPAAGERGKAKEDKKHRRAKAGREKEGEQ